MKLTRTALLAFLLPTLLADTAAAASLKRISVNNFQVQGNDASYLITLSDDGRLVTFSSDASNLAGIGLDTNNQRDIFLRDQLTGTVTRINLGPGGIQANGFSECPVISADGSVVVYGSYASTIAGAPNTFFENIYLYDVATGQTERISKSNTGGFPNDGCSLPTVSGDGRYVTYFAIAWNIDNSPVSGGVYLYDRVTGTTKRISNGFAGEPATGFFPNISADGKYIAYVSAWTSLVPGDTNLVQDVFRYNVQTGTTERVSVSGSGGEANALSQAGGIGIISADGRYVVFESDASNLVPNDFNNHFDVFVRDMQLGTTERVSETSAGIDGNGDSSWAVISRDGRFIAYESDASNLVPGDTNLSSDVFVFDRKTRLTVRVSNTHLGAEGNAGSFAPAINGDGRQIGFFSHASNLVPLDSNGVSDLFVHSQCWVSAEPIGVGLAGTGGVTPTASLLKGTCFENGYELRIDNVVGGAAGFLFAGLGTVDQFPVFGGGHFYINLATPFFAQPLMVSGAAGVAGAGSLNPIGADLNAVSTGPWYVQYAALDAGTPQGVSLSNAVKVTTTD